MLFEGHRIYDKDIDFRTVFITGAISMLFHLTFFAVLIYASPLLDSPGKITSVDVSLASFEPGVGPKPSTEEASPKELQPDNITKEQPQPEVRKQKEPEPQETVSIPDEPVVPIQKPEKPEPKEPQPKTLKIVKPKILKPKQIEQEAPDEIRSKQILKAIAKIKNEVQKDGAGTSSGTGTGSSAATGTAGTGDGTADILDIYKVEIAHMIQLNWAFPEQLAGGETDGEAILTFRVFSNGQISNIRITKSSGNNYLDKSAMDAVRKTSPVNPFPKPVSLPYLEISLLCGASGLK